MENPTTADAPAGRRRRVVAAVIVAVAWGGAAGAIALSVAYGHPIVAHGEFLSLYLLNAIVWGAASGLLIARGPDPVGVIAAATGVGSALSALARQLARTPGTEWLDRGVAEHILDRLWMPGTLAMIGVLPLLLTSRPLSPRIRALVAIGLAAAALPLAISPLRQKPGAALNPLGIDVPAVQSAVGAVFVVALGVCVGLAVVTAAVLAWRWRRGPVDERRGMGWLVLGQVLLIVFFGPTFLPWLPVTSEEVFRHAPLAPVVAVVFMAAAVVVVGLRGRLRGIEATANRVVVDILLLAVVVMAYVSIAATLAGALPVPPMIAGVAGVVAFALLLNPLHRFLQRRVDAFVYGDAADPTQLLARLGGERHDGDLLASLVTELRGALRLGTLEVRADHALPSGSNRYEMVLPLRGPAGVVGWVRAAAPGRQRLDQRTRRVLEGIAGVLAVALQLDVVHRELGEARDRAVAAGDEERRMLRRELHDGLAPALAGTAMRLARAARQLPDPVARADLSGIRSELARSTTDVRDLARTLLPGALDAGDLDTALRELAERFSGNALTITVSSSRADELGVTQQNAVHHLAAEAVLLLRRAAAPRSAVLSLVVAAETAEVELAADASFARGPDAQATLRSIADRAAELGGRSRVDDDGRRIRVEVPR